MSHVPIFLLVLVSLFLGPSRQLSPAQLRPEQPSYVLEPGQEVIVRFLIENASNVYGIDVRATYDPSLVELMDADPRRDGVQVVPGEFPQPDFLAVNSANTQTGEIRYVTTQLNPTPPASGSGVVFAVRLRGLGVSGSSEFRIESVEMSSRDGALLPVQWSGATIETGGDNAQAPVGQATGVAIAPATAVVPSVTPTTPTVVSGTETPAASPDSPTPIQETSPVVSTQPIQTATSQLVTEPASATSGGDLAADASEQNEVVPPVATETLTAARQTATPVIAVTEAAVLEDGSRSLAEPLIEATDSSIDISMDTSAQQPEAVTVIGDNTQPGAEEVQTAGSVAVESNRALVSLAVAVTVLLAVAAFLLLSRQAK